MSVLRQYEGLWYELRRAAGAFAAVTVLSFAACLALPALRQALMDFLLQAIEGKDIALEERSTMAMQLLSSNLLACGMAMLLGLVPFLQLSALPLGLNALVLGVLGAWYLAEGQSLALYLAALLPHGVVELPALLLSLAVGLYICGQLSRRCRRDETALSFGSCLLLAGRKFK